MRFISILFLSGVFVAGECESFRYKLSDLLKNRTVFTIFLCKYFNAVVEICLVCKRFAIELVSQKRTQNVATNCLKQFCGFDHCLTIESQFVSSN